MIIFDSNICNDFEKNSSREWLETNGIGGFACSTISGANTRRYHGLLTAATRPPLGRVTMLSKFEETLVINDEKFELSSNQYPQTVHPQGFKYLKSFRLSPFPVWLYEINGVEITRTIFMVHGSNSTVCEWSVINQENIENKTVKLELKPLLSFVGYHALQKEMPDLDFKCETSEDYILIKPPNDFPALFLNHNAVEREKTGVWYKDFEYTIEKERGFDFKEDLFQPFSLAFDLNDTVATVIASTEPQILSDAITFRMTETARRDALILNAKAEDDFTKQLVLASDQFIVSRGKGKTIIAGYPWFSDWGRDTMIALEGLTLTTNRPEVAKNILLEFSKHISKGMIPNRFPDEGETPEYNTVDATLWYFEAIRAYAKKTDDYSFIKEQLYEKLVEIIYWHVRGTAYQIKVDDDGLLYAGEEGSQLTWMDAKLDEEVFTPRIGKPVEIQALWYNALCVMSEFADRFGDKDGKHQYEKMARLAKKSFNDSFWNENDGCLFDVINGDEKDASVRPNQIFAVSLPNSMLSIFRAQKIVKKVENELFTPFGLRSLSPEHQDYLPIYKGSPYERDSAYHQGTVWAWLMGAFIKSIQRVYPNGKKAKKYYENLFESFGTHLTDEGIGQISEIFDGDEPNEPRGCFAQAWSVAEILRVVSNKN